MAIRNKLKILNGQRLRFSATVERFGEKPALKGGQADTVLLNELRLLGSDEPLTDHLWMNKCKSFESCSPGSKVEFDARVTVYEKGYKGRRDDVYDAPIEIDYRLERPTKFLVK